MDSFLFIMFMSHTCATFSWNSLLCYNCKAFIVKPNQGVDEQTPICNCMPHLVPLQHDIEQGFKSHGTGYAAVPFHPDN